MSPPTRLGWLPSLVFAAGCGSVAHAVPSKLSGPAAPTVAFTGRVQYEARASTPRGASAALERRPARHVHVQLRAGVAVVAEGDTDETGRFTLEAPDDATELVVLSRVAWSGHDAMVSRDPNGALAHEHHAPARRDAMDVLIDDAAPGGAAGAFHILDTALRGLEAVRAWTGDTLPPVYVYWGRGITTVWSFYRGERPSRSGRFALELMGGDPGRQASTDTDEHDESIILHELGHFVMDRLSGDSSPGGNHPRGVLIDPGLAWEEGRATWFSCAVLGVPRYVDTIGLEPGGHTRIDHDVERGEEGPRGIGSEAGVVEVLWDLTDGTDALPDGDADGVALGPAAVLSAMVAQSRVPGAYPSLPTFLRSLVAGNVVQGAVLKQLLTATRQPDALLPETDVAPWPLELAVSGSAGGKIDGVTNPAPSGGPPRPENGLDAMRAYRVRVERGGFLTVVLRIAGTGRAADHTDLDLELRDLRAELLANSNGEVPVESVGRVVEPGWYVVYVRDGGSGNRAAYTVEARLE